MLCQTANIEWGELDAWNNVYGTTSLGEDKTFSFPSSIVRQWFSVQFVVCLEDSKWPALFPRGNSILSPHLFELPSTLLLASLPLHSINRTIGGGSILSIATRGFPPEANNRPWCHCDSPLGRARPAGSKCCFRWGSWSRSILSCFHNSLSPSLLEAVDQYREHKMNIRSCYRVL